MGTLSRSSSWLTRLHNSGVTVAHLCCNAALYTKAIEDDELEGEEPYTGLDLTTHYNLGNASV